MDKWINTDNKISDIKYNLIMKSSKKVASDYADNESLVLHLGDSLEFLRTIPDQTIRFILTSPPYNIGKDYEETKQFDQYLDFQKQILTQCKRVLTEDGSICWQVGNHVSEEKVIPLDIVFYPLFIELGFIFHNRIIWHYNHGLHWDKRYSGRYETILWFSKSENYLFDLDAIRVPSKYIGKRKFKGAEKGKPSCNPLGKNPSDLWEFVAQEWDKEIWEITNVKSNHPEKTNHPCQFPIELCERCILAHSKENDWVLDPFMGVGSTVLAALLHNRKAMGIDKESDYLTITKSRVTELLNGTLKYRPIGKPIYKPSGRDKSTKMPKEWQLLGE